MVFGFVGRNKLAKVEEKLRLARELVKISNQIARGKDKEYGNLLKRREEIEKELKKLGLQEEEIESLRGIKGPGIPLLKETMSKIKREAVKERKRVFLSPFKKIIAPVKEWKTKAKAEKVKQKYIKYFEVEGGGTKESHRKARKREEAYKKAEIGLSREMQEKIWKEAINEYEEKIDKNREIKYIETAKRLFESEIKTKDPIAATVNVQQYLIDLGVPKEKASEYVRIAARDISKKKYLDKLKMATSLYQDFFLGKISKAELISQVKDLPRELRMKARNEAIKGVKEIEKRWKALELYRKWEEGIPQKKLIKRQERKEKIKSLFKELEPEESRLPRAIAWAKRRLDHEAKGIEHEVKEFVENEKKKAIEDIEKEIKKLTQRLNGIDETVQAIRGRLREIKEIERETDKVRVVERPIGEIEELRTTLQDKLAERRKVLEELDELEKEKRRRIEYIERELFRDEEAKVEAILRSKADDIAEEACRHFHLSATYLPEIKQALYNFSSALARRLVASGFKKTFYRHGKASKLGYGFKTFGLAVHSFHENLTHILIGIIGGAIVGGIIGMFINNWLLIIAFAVIGLFLSWDYARDVFFEFAFSSVFFGVIIVYALYWISSRYINIGIGSWALIILIPVFITLMLSLSEMWSHHYG